MPGLLEKMGLVKTDYEPELPHAAEDGRYGGVDAPQVEIDASEVTCGNIIESIYEQGELQEDSSIFKVKAYIDILPPEMTTPKKQASIAGILVVNNLDINALVNDGRERINLLNAASAQVASECDGVIAEAEADIEHLKGLIEAAEEKIAEAKQRAGDVHTAVCEEVDVINGLLSFANGILSPGEDGK